MTHDIVEPEKPVENGDAIAQVPTETALKKQYAFATRAVHAVGHDPVTGAVIEPVSSRSPISFSTSILCGIQILFIYIYSYHCLWNREKNKNNKANILSHRYPSPQPLPKPQ